MTDFGYIPASYSSASSPEWVRTLTMLLILLVLLLAGLLAGLGRQGTDLSLDNRYYRPYFGLLGLRLGRWQPLPPVLGVTLKFYATMGSHTGTSAGPANWGIWDTSDVRYEKLVLLLSLQNSDNSLIIREFNTDKLAEARAAAQEVAGRFGVAVHEYLVPQRTQRR